MSQSAYLMLGAIIFGIGGVGLMIRRNPIVMFMCVELMLNAVNLTFVSFANALNDIRGQVIVFFVLSVAAAEVAVGLGIIVATCLLAAFVPARRAAHINPIATLRAD